VTLDHVGNQSSDASDWTRVTAPHDGDPADGSLSGSADSAGS
jgi:hypothetical protein